MPCHAMPSQARWSCRHASYRPAVCSLFVTLLSSIPATASSTMSPAHRSRSAATGIRKSLFPRASLAGPSPTPKQTMISPSAPTAIPDPAPVSIADAPPVNDGMKSSSDAFALQWDAGVILALVLVCVFVLGVGAVVMRHYLRRRRHRLTMAALANMRSGGGPGGNGLATINGLAGRRGQVTPSMARMEAGVSGPSRRTLSGGRCYNPRQQAYLGGAAAVVAAAAVRSPPRGGGDGGAGASITRTPTSRSAASSTCAEGNSSLSATLATSPASSSSTSPSTPLLQLAPHLPLPAGLTINTGRAGHATDLRGSDDDTLDGINTKRQTVHSMQWIPAPSSAIFSPLDMTDSNSTIDFLDALQLVPPVPQLPRPALLRVCNTGGSSLSIASDDAPSPPSASPASSYCSVASSATVRPSSTASSVASFASAATLGPSSLVSSRRSPAVPPLRTDSASTSSSSPLVPSTPRSLSLPMASVSHMFPTGVRGSAPPSVLSTASSGTGSLFGSPQVGPIKTLPRSTSLSPIQI